MAPVEKGIVFNIQRYSVHDGPGIRTTVFLKGCPLNCPWCCNPESINIKPEILFFEHSCIGCEACLKVCPEHALRRGEDRKIEIERSLCNNCFKCTETCIAGGLRRVGTLMNLEEVVGEIEKDCLFFKRSNGGVTLSGGEPTLQPEFAHALLQRCKRIGLNSVIQTCGFQKWELFSSIAMDADIVMYDLKIMDPVKHKEIMGGNNEQILENARKLVSSNRTDVFFRIPIIPGFTDSAQNLEAACEFLAGIGYRKKIGLVPYHRFGEQKYAFLGRKYMLRETKPVSKEGIEEKCKILKSYGLEVEIIGS